MKPVPIPVKAQLLSLSFTLFALPTASAAVIYQHNFSGSPGNTLNGVALDTANGTLGGTAGATWLANADRYFADGTITSTASSASTYVPFVPVSGYEYTITLNVDITSASSTNWVALSLFNGTPNTGGAFNTVSTTYASIGRRHSTASDSSGTDLLRWQGPSNGGTNLHINEPQTGIWNISILLNTTNPANWTFQWLMQGDNNTEHLTGSYNLGTTTISHIMISNTVNVSADLSGFSVTAIPEPGLTLLSSLGTGLLAFRRARRG